jgi:hypothetical protein
MNAEMMNLIAAALGGWALTFGWGIGADWFRRRGARKVKAALRDVDRAKLTTDDKDDVIAQLALERAREDDEFMQWLADHVEKNKPILPFPGPR